MFNKNHLMCSIFSISGIFALLLLSGCGEHAGKQDTSRKTEARFRDYKVIISESDESRVEIFKGAALVYAMDGHRFFIGNPEANEKKEIAIPIGMDITGDGQPDLVIHEYTGGAHCCSLFHIFEIGEKFRHIQTIELEDSCTDFKNLDNGPALELPMNDWTFAYWKTSFADSPAPEVILKYSDGQYRMAPTLMRKPPLSPLELNGTAASIRLSPEWKDPEQKIPPALWREMLNLIYTGNMDQAWSLFHLAWPEGLAGKEKFLEEFKAQLATSLYWEQIQDMNKGGSVKAP